jgi:hypothetical protein
MLIEEEIAKPGGPSAAFGARLIPDFIGQHPDRKCRLRPDLMSTAAVGCRAGKPLTPESRLTALAEERDNNGYQKGKRPAVLERTAFPL